MTINYQSLKNTAQNMKFSNKDFFSKCYQWIRSFLRIWSHLLKKSLMENFIFCAVSRNHTIPTELACSHLLSIIYVGTFVIASAWSYKKSLLREAITAWKVAVFRVFLVRLFPHLDWMRRFASWCSPNAGKYGPEKLRIRSFFRQSVFTNIVALRDHVVCFWKLQSF